MLYRQERSSDGWSGYEVETHSQRWLCKSGGLLLGGHCQSPSGSGLCLCLERPGKTVVAVFFVIVYLSLFLNIKETVILEIVFVFLIPNLLPLSIYTNTSKMSALNLDDLDNNDLNKRLLTQIKDWPDECGKCGQPKLLQRELHRASSCNEP